MRPFTWYPDKAFEENFKKIHDKYSHLTMDSTVFGVETDEAGNVISTINYHKKANENDCKL